MNHELWRRQEESHQEDEEVGQDLLDVSPVLLRESVSGNETLSFSGEYISVLEPICSLRKGSLYFTRKKSEHLRRFCAFFKRFFFMPFWAFYGFCLA